MIATVNELVEKISNLLDDKDMNLQPMCQRGNEEIRSIVRIVVQDGKLIIKMY